MTLSFLGLILLLFIIGVIVAVGAAASSGQRTGQTDRPRCGKCGYAVEGLPTFTCPECGSDLRRVGIATPELRPRRGGRHPVFAVTLWSIAMAAATMSVCALLSELDDWVTVHNRHTLLSQPRSGAYVEAKCSYTGPLSGRVPDPPRLELTLRPVRGDLLVMTIDPRDWAWESRTAGGKQLATGDSFSVETVLTWMAAAGIDETDPAVRAEASDIAQLVQLYGTSSSQSVSLPSFGSQTSSNTTRGTRTRPWIDELLLAVVVIAVVIWLSGIWRLITDKPLLPKRRSASNPV